MAALGMFLVVFALVAAIIICYRVPFAVFLSLVAAALLLGSLFVIPHSSVYSASRFLLTDLLGLRGFLFVVVLVLVAIVTLLGYYNNNGRRQRRR